MNQALRRVGSILGAAVCATTLCAPLTTAHAETQTHRDPRGDVASSTVGRRAADPGIDITRTTNRFDGRGLRLRLDTAGLARSGYDAFWAIRTPETVFVLSFSRSGGRSSVGFYDAGDVRRPARSPGHRPRGVEPTCRGVDVDRQQARDALVGSVPRRCLDGARSVRIASQMQRQTDDGFEIDDARRDGFDVMRNVNPRYGPRLERG